MISLDAKRADAFLQTYDAYSATVGEDICSTGERVTLDNGESSADFFHEALVATWATDCTAKYQRQNAMYLFWSQPVLQPSSNETTVRCNY